MSPRIAKFLLQKVLGWHFTKGEDSIPNEKKALFLFAPHTSIWDFVIGLLYFRSLGGKLHIMIKKEAFKGPLGTLLKKAGAFPIDRKNPSGALVPLIHEINKSDSFYLVVCPEGTRKPIHRWKTGYHTIAVQTGIPVFLSHADYRKKEIGYGKTFPLTADARKDTESIQQKYKEMKLVGLRAGGYVTE